MGTEKVFISRTNKIRLECNSLFLHVACSFICKVKCVGYKKFAPGVYRAESTDGWRASLVDPILATDLVRFECQ